MDERQCLWCGRKVMVRDTYLGVVGCDVCQPKYGTK